MSVSTELSEASFDGNGELVVFEIPFKYFATSELTVWLREDDESEEVVQTEGQGLIVYGGSGPEGTGTVEFIFVPPDGSTIRIERNTPVLQPTAYRTNGTFAPGVHERSFDRLTHICQELERRIADLEAGSGGQQVEVSAGAMVLVDKTFTTDADAVEDTFPVGVNFSIPDQTTVPTGVWAVKIENLTDPGAESFTPPSLLWHVGGTDYVLLDFVAGLEPNTQYKLTLAITGTASEG